MTITNALFEKSRPYFLVILLLSALNARAEFLGHPKICEQPDLVSCLPTNTLRLVTEAPGDILATALFPLTRERIGRTAMDFAFTFAVMPFDRDLSPEIWQLSDWSGKVGMRPQTPQSWYIPGFLFFDSVMSYALPVIHVAAAFRNDSRLYRASFLGMKVWAYSILVPIPFRYVVQRSYPYDRNGELNSPFDFHSNDDFNRDQSVLKGAGSFPSFRAAMWFGLADTFAYEYGYNFAWYSAASALTLLADHRHWASDLVFGAFVGLSVSQSVRTRYLNDKTRTFILMPFANSDMVGITVGKTIK